MPGRDLIVIGASAGGVEAVSSLLAGLPADLHAAVCVVIHLRPDASSQLAAVLARTTTLPVVAARNGMTLQPGVVYVGVPDLHMLVEHGDSDGAMLRLVRGPRENRTRPSVDPLFRSAALVFGPRVIGVVLSGALDDGAGGLWTVKDRGGMAVVQDPDDAAVPSMPSSALAEVEVDYVAPAQELGALLGRLASEAAPSAPPGETSQPTDELAREVGITAMEDVPHMQRERYGRPSRFSCPDCGGVLWDLSEKGPMRFRCEVGHAHSAATLAETQTEVVEAAMWSALRALEDKAELARRRATAATARGLDAHAAHFGVQEQAAQQHASALRALLMLDGHAGIRPRLHPEHHGEPLEQERVDVADGGTGNGAGNGAHDEAGTVGDGAEYSGSVPRAS
jgi:two-component system, chemotaxis family, protein-glutamate methylesterase/glutaminase